MQGETGGATFCLSVLGPWRLAARQSDITIPSRKARDILTYLVLETASAQPRPVLADLFWPDSGADLARSSLRQALSILKRALDEAGPDILTITPDGIGLHKARVTTDLAGLVARLADGTFRQADCHMVEALQTMLLTSFGAPGPALEDWLRDARARLVGDVQAAVAQAVDRRDIPGDLRLRLARAALVLDAYDEAAARAVMRCLVEAGNAAAALRFYGSFYERLDVELDAEPSVETQDLAVQIKQMQAASTLPSDAMPAAVPAVPRPASGFGAIVAVLPFESLGPDAVPGHVSLGLLDQITCHLATFRAPAVISSNSTRGYLGRSPGIAEVRTALQADYIVTGSILTRGSEARVQVQLADGRSGVILWAQAFPARSEMLFDIHATIAERIANAVVPSVDLAELRRVEADSFDLLEPYHLVLRAKDLILRLDRGSMDRAGALLADAERKDPGFGPMHALRAEWLAIRLWQGWTDSPDPDRQALESHALRAIAALPGNGRSMALLAHCRTVFSRNHADALRLFDKALSICPNDAETLAWTVPTLAFCDRTDEAIRHGEQAVALSPLDPFLFRNEHFLSIAHYAAGDPARAAELGLSAHARVPDYGSNLRMTIAALEAAGRRAEARPLVEQHARVHPDFSVSALVPRIGFQQPATRAIFAQRLVAAGLPA